MSSITVISQQSNFVLRSLRAPSPWQAFVLPVSGFPIPDPTCSAITDLVRRISSRAAARWKLFSEVFMELEQMKGLECRYLLSDHGKEWLPEVGLGVWPDREPPALWTRQEFEDLPPGGKLRELVCEVFRISTTPEHRTRARDEMLKFGPVVEILTSCNTSEFLGNMKPVYLSFIKERSHRCFPYYIPLLEGSTIEKMSAEQLQNWCPGISVYFRESFKDKGILLASSLPLGEVFEDLGGRPDSQSEGSDWKIPI